MKSQYKYSILFIILITLVLNLYILFASLSSVKRIYKSELEKITAIQNDIEENPSVPDSLVLAKTKKIFGIDKLFIIGYQNPIRTGNKYYKIFENELKKGIIKNKVVEIDKQHYMFIIPEITKHFYIVGIYDNPLFQVIDSQKSLLLMTLISSFGIILIFIIISLLSFKPMIYMEFLAKNVRTPVKDEIYYNYIPRVFKETIETLKEKNRELERFYSKEKEHSKNIETFLRSSLNLIETPIYLFKEDTLLYENTLSKRISDSFSDIEKILPSWKNDEITIGDVTYYIMKNSIKRGEIELGTLFVLFDATKSKNRSIIEKNINIMELLSNVSVNLAHEFKNSLGIISGYIQMLKKKTDIKELEILESETGYMLNSINKFIEINRINKIIKQAVKIDDLKTEFMKLASRISLDLSFSCETSFPLLIDRQLFLQAIKNAFINSKEADATKIDVSIYKNNSYTILEIKDNGKGFTENAMKNLFVPFFTEKEHGSGIGMVFINRVITLHNAIVHAGNYENGAYIKIIFTE